MPVVEQAIVIKAPMARVMAALNAVENIPNWATVSGVIDHVQGRGAGMTYAWRYQFNNLNFEGRSEVLEQTADTLITRTTGDVDSLWTITLSPAGANRTAMRVNVEYTAPNTFMEILADIVLEQLGNPAVARENMQRFKEMVEAQTDSVEGQIVAHA
ncbi:MAG: hypothetical protein D6768_02610 [Chloroflexi bacterium]|nr:MAG: hypothetical protein D6768_02610 [Chloroflexota bacterium]